MKPKAAVLEKILRVPVSGLTRLERLAWRVVLARELEYLRHSMGYAGGGAWQSFREETLSGTRPTWAAWVKENASFTEATARNYSRCGRVVLARLREGGHADAVALMEERPSNLTNDQRQSMIAQIQRHGLRETDTPSSLRREFKQGMGSGGPANEAPPKRSPSALDIVFQAEAIKAAALAAGVAPGAAGRVAMMILCRDFAATVNGKNIIRYWLNNPSGGGSSNLEFPEK